tara:strand:- start:110 stop:658 length:549 start_codon:yes stop_codon:yes gene_type:complete
MNQLKNKFLVAMPSINDPIFRKSLILICDYTEEGAMGLIINKPIDDNIIMNVFHDFEINEIDTNSKVYFGGPVGLDTGFVLHESNYATKQTLSISNELSLTSNQEVFDDINNNIGPNKHLVTLGYAGWEKKQLDKEIKNGDWLVVPSDLNFIFKIEDEIKWDISSSVLGFDMSILTGKSGLT